MSNTLTTENTDSVFVCDCEEDVRSACTGEPFYGEHEAKRYCVLHYPGKGKSKDFKESLKRKLEAKNSDFRGIWFPDRVSSQIFDFGAKAWFSGATFNETADFSGIEFSAEVDFSYATFKAEVYFSDSTFNAKADFRSAEFGANADFIKTTFNATAYFRFSKFSREANFETRFNAEVDFLYAIFVGEAYFRYATFKAKVNLRSATFSSYARFGEHGFVGQSSLDLQYARIEKPDHVSFHTLALRPHWFVNVDVRKFDFTNIEWRGSIDQEIENLRLKKIVLPRLLITITYRQLAVNAEENHRYDEASDFRYKAMHTLRPEKWRGFTPWRLGWWYWLASGYGERILQAFGVLIVVWLLFALLYTQVGFVRWEPRLTSESDVATAKRDETGEPLRPPRAFAYSLGVMTLQRPEPRPATLAAQSVVILETIFGPLQAALLALAIRRRFMR
jgi:hypothetical protein